MVFDINLGGGGEELTLSLSVAVRRHSVVLGPPAC